jgi:tetratricopeptide (TPR) repeat protein
LLGVQLILLGACEPRKEDGSANGSVSGGTGSDRSPMEMARLHHIAIASLDAGLTKEAGDRLEQLILLLPKEPSVWANRAIVEMRGKDHTRVDHFLGRAVELAPDDPEIVMLQSEWAHRQDRLSEQKRLLTRAVELAPENVRYRYALLDWLNTYGQEEDVALAAEQLKELVRLAPNNFIVRHEASMQAADVNDNDAIARHLRAIDEIIRHWPESVRDAAAEAKSAVDSEQGPVIKGGLRLLGNLARPTKQRQIALSELSTAIDVPGQPLRTLRSIDIPPTKVSTPEPIKYVDVTEQEGLIQDTPLKGQIVGAAISEGTAFSPAAVIALADKDVLMLRHRFTNGRFETIQTLQRTNQGRPLWTRVVDLNNDGQLDVVIGTEGGDVESYLQSDKGEFSPAGDRIRWPLSKFSSAVSVFLPMDADLDGDLDILIADDERNYLFRNNGDGRFVDLADEMGLTLPEGDVVDHAVWGDVDGDGDPDVIAHARKADQIILFENHRGGRFTFHTKLVDAGPQSGRFAYGDFDNDGYFDLFLSNHDGNTVWRNDGLGRLRSATNATWRGASLSGQLTTEDINRDGLLDVISSHGQTAINLGDFSFRGDTLLNSAAKEQTADKSTGASGDGPSIPSEIDHVVPFDMDADGNLDIVVFSSEAPPALLKNESTDTPAWHNIVLKAHLKGDQRNNSFAIGALLEVRAGSFYQRRVVDAPVTHIGLNGLDHADVVRVIWPHGASQYIIEPPPNTTIVEEQRLTGSCPYLFAWNGKRMEFVTDLIWRSPVGMKINAQDVHVVDTTQDYVKVSAEQLVGHDGQFQLAVTTDLWETEFFDEIKLICVDHPSDVDIFVDERFIPGADYEPKIEVVEHLLVPVSALDHRGKDVLHTIKDRDGRHLGGFEFGPYQGVAEDHFVELSLGQWEGDPSVRLIAQGWIFPTDANLNVAIGQSTHSQPQPLSIQVPDGSGQWKTVIANAGFPAGKTKTAVIDLTGLLTSGDHRVRLSTNLEIYWDRIAFTLGTPSRQFRTKELAPVKADLRYHGINREHRIDPRSPALPDYDDAVPGRKWRDLEGWYTRFGDVRELLDSSDDRYVIMNAGDVIRLSFDAPPPPPSGWTRDFLFFSDGWVKDGAWNTVASQTVAPYPFHDMPAYPYPESAIPSTLLPDHPDWQTYHTRWISPTEFSIALRPNP